MKKPPPEPPDKSYFAHLFDGYPAHVKESFKKFHEENPHVYREFKRRAFQMRATGRTRYSARCIMEVVRWHVNLETKGDVFEIGNNFIPIYVRLLIYHHNEFFGFFELREVTSKGIPSKEERRRRLEMKEEDEPA